MTHDGLITPPALSISQTSPVTNADSLVPCDNDNRSLEEKPSTESCSLPQHQSCDENGCIDSEMWSPPEAEDRDDDIDDSIANYGNGSSNNMYGQMIPHLQAGVRIYVKYLLNSKGISCSGNDGDTWVDTIMDLSLKSVSNLRLDLLYGEEENPDLHVKVKCIATGTRNQSKFFKGLVCKPQAAHSHMPVEFIKPKLLLIWDESPDGLISSLESNKQEEVIMGMIERFNPNVVLVEKNISPDIQKSILEKGIALVMEMNEKRLEKVAMCTGSPMSTAELKKQMLTECESIYFETIEEEHAALCDNVERPMKTIMYLGGYTTRTGLTILLKGSHSDELKKIKWIVRHAVYATYKVIREGLYIKREAAINPVEKTILLDCNKDMKHKNEITAVIGSRRMSFFISRHIASSGTVCLSDIDFYQNFDMPFGKFLVDDLFNKNLSCGTCKNLPEAHISCFAHEDRKLTVEVKHLPSDKHLPGENEGKIWMWNFCGQCEPSNRSLKPTKRVLVPVADRNLSFGSILELAFLNLLKWKKPFSCGHYYYGDYLHFYGLGSMVAMFRYSTVPTYSVAFPTRKVRFIDSNEGDFVKEVDKLFEIGCSMFAGVEKSLDEIKNKLVGSSSNCRGSCEILSYIKEMLKQDEDQFKVQRSDIYVDKWSHKPLYLDHMYEKLALHLYIWNARVRSISSSYFGLVDTQISDGKFPLVLPLKSADPEPEAWVWRPFSEIESFYFNYLQSVYQRIAKEGSRLHFLLGSENHMVTDYEDELSGIIASALALASLQDRNNPSDVKSYQSLQTISSLSSPNWFSFSFFMDSHGYLFCYPSESQELVHSTSDGLELSDSSSYLHPVISMGRLDKTPKYSVACLFPKEFHDLRSHCGLSEEDYITSLNRSKHWDAKGGKSKSFFAKTLDDRFIIKQISKTEFRSFHTTAFAYFAYMKKGDTTCLAKIFGVYQVTKKKGNKRYDVMVMENITYCQNLTRLYDLKGTQFCRFNAATDGVGNVYLDQNFVDDMNISPIYLDMSGVQKLLRAIRNDTSFLHSIGVMDYSLLVGVDTERSELVCGIIDYLREYTLDKILENWLKKTFIVPKNQLPTIIPPEDYMKRFVEFIKNFLGVGIS